LPSEQDVQPPVAEAPALCGQLAQALPEHVVVTPPATVARVRSAHAHQPAGVALRERSRHAEEAHDLTVSGSFCVNMNLPEARQVTLHESRCYTQRPVCSLVQRTTATTSRTEPPLLLVNRKRNIPPRTRGRVSDANCDD